MKNDIKLANKIDAECLVSGVGHDWVTIARDRGGSIESWVECWRCGKNIMELERQCEDCKHEMRCIKCGFPLKITP